MKRIAAPMAGGVITSEILELAVCPAGCREPEREQELRNEGI
jgi:Cu/Ag efflux pump CusA